LLEKFWPVKGWTEEDLKKLKKYDSNFRDKKPDMKRLESLPGRVQQVPEWYRDNSRMEKSKNYIQISEGKRLILLDVENRSKEKPSGPGLRPTDGRRNHGTVYSIEPSKGIIYYSDDEVSLKILIKKLK
jgi:hypothetical protein